MTEAKPTPISRDEAKAQGLKRYFTGKPCRNGHIAERNTLNGRCLPCAVPYSQNWRQAHHDVLLVAERVRRAKNADVINAKKRADIKTNPEPFREYGRKYREANPQKNKDRYNAYYAANKEKVDEAGRLWRAANPEKIKAAAKARYETNKDRRLEYARARRAANPNEHRVQRQRRRARLKGAEGSHTVADVARILNHQKCKCAECRISLKAGYHIDHIIPLFLGGSNWPANLQLLCQRCNQRKHALDPIEWARRNGRLL